MILSISRKNTAYSGERRGPFRRVGLILLACAITTVAVGRLERNAVLAQAKKPAQKAPPRVHVDNVADRSEAVIDHLNSVLRFYRDSQSPIQKVGEPSDTVYRDQAVALATQIGRYAFQSAKAEAVLFDGSGQGNEDSGSHAARLKQFQQKVEQQIASLKQRDAELAGKIANARAKDLPALQEQRQQVKGELELQTAMEDAVAKLTGISDTSADTGFGAQVNQLERSAPGLTAGKPPTAAPTLDSLSAARSSGVTSQAKVLFQLLSTRESIDGLIKEAEDLHAQALALRTPLVSQLKETMAEGQALSQNAAGASSSPTSNPNGPSPTNNANAPAQTPAAPNAGTQAPTVAATQAAFDRLTATFNALSASSVPLSQEIMTLEQGQASLQAWRRAVNDEYLSILRSLLLRVAFIAVALLVIFGLGEVWSRATRKYVHDVRRRRQLLVVRRLVTGFLSGLVLIFGLVTEFSSLATFAGFITAGIAVGLQTILLSVAAYFFIIGRYGVKVGDRITIAGVTGDVVEVGLVRFYVMELAGSAADLYPSGRVAVFSNAVLFQAGTPLYKQIPGTRYGWHELTVKLAADGDYRPAVQEIVQTLKKVYESYGEQVERQHKSLSVWMDSALDSPDVRSNVQFLDGGLQLWVRFPVILRQAAVIDEKMSEAMAQLIASDEKVKAVVSSPPVIKAAVKG